MLKRSKIIHKYLRGYSFSLEEDAIRISSSSKNKNLDYLIRYSLNEQMYYVNKNLCC